MQGLLSQASVLRKVTLRSTDGDALRARQGLERTLDSIDWALPGLPPQAVLLVRRMVLAPRGTAEPAHAGALAQQVSRALQASAGSARRPWLRNDAPAAEAVLFLDEAELAACLVSDALRGRVTTHWWWRAVLVGRTAQEWLRSEVMASGRLIAPTLSLLAGKSQAVPWAERWTEAEAKMGLAALGQEHAWVPSVDLELNVGIPVATPGKANGSAGEMALRPSRADVNRVLTTVPELRHAATLSTPAAHLLAASLLLSRDPAWLRTARGTAACAAWVALRQHELPRALPTPNEVPGAASGAAKAAQPQELASMTKERLTAQPTAAPTVSTARSARGQGPADAQRTPRAPLHTTSPPFVQSSDLVVGVRHSSAALQGVGMQSAMQTTPPGSRLPVEAMHLASPAAPATLGPQQPTSLASALPTQRPQGQSNCGLALQSEYGGIFYLLNIALALELYGDFTQPRTLGLALSPWDLLAWTGRTWFGTAFERDPVWPLLAELAGRSPSQMPGRSFAPPSPTGFAGDWVINPAWLSPWGPKPTLRWRRTALREYAWHPAGFVVRDVALSAAPPPRSRRAIWLRRLLGYVQARAALALGADDAAQVPHLLCRHVAEIQVSATAVDVTLSLDALPLSVRLAGLDRNPGWIPAAGRSIHFHFR